MEKKRISDERLAELIRAAALRREVEPLFAEQLAQRAVITVKIGDIARAVNFLIKRNGLRTGKGSRRNAARRVMLAHLIGNQRERRAALIIYRRAVRCGAIYAKTRREHTKRPKCKQRKEEHD